MEEKRKRTNFTNNEKGLLLSIVAKYDYIVEDKCTKATNVENKNRIWETISEEFNLSAESGLRSAKQLRVLYDNTKRERRRSGADKHLEKYIEKINIAKQVAAVEKGEFYDTGTTAYSYSLSSEEEKPLAIFHNEINPLDNGTAADYCEDANLITFQNPETITPPQPKMNSHRFKKRIMQTEQLKRRYYLKKLEIANFELYSKKKLLFLETKKLKLEIKKLEQ